MAFCTNCGASVTGEFCTNCGARLGGAQQAAPAAPPQKQSNALKFVLIGCLGVIVLGAVIASVTFWFVGRKVKDVADLAEKNPGLAAAKILAAINPEIEVVSTDEAKGTLTVREKKTGKTVTVTIDDAKKGRIVFESEGQKVEIGAEAKVPSWLPKYPGAKEEGVFSAQGSEGEGGTFGFKTSDSPEQVASFYEDRFKKDGMKTVKSTIQKDGASSVINLAATEERERRHANVTITSGDDGTSVAVIFGEK